MLVSRRAKAAAAAAVSLALLTSACGGDAGDDDGGKTTLTLGLYGTFGYEEAGLYDEYMELHPDIKIEQTVVALIEQELNGIENLSYMDSQSELGRATINLTFWPGTSRALLANPFSDWNRSSWKSR